MGIRHGGFIDRARMIAVKTSGCKPIWVLPQEIAFHPLSSGKEGVTIRGRGGLGFDIGHLTN
jgi:hypothetical protein